MMATTLRKLLVSTLALTSCSGSSLSSSLGESSKYNIPSDSSSIKDNSNDKIETAQNKSINPNDIIRVHFSRPKRENHINTGMSSRMINHKTSAFHRLMKSKRNDVITTTSMNARRSLIAANISNSEDGSFNPEKYTPSPPSSSMIAANNTNSEDGSFNPEKYTPSSPSSSMIAANSTNSEDGSFNPEKYTPSSRSSSTEDTRKKTLTNNPPKKPPSETISKSQEAIDPTIIVEFIVGLNEMNEIVVNDFFTEKQQESDALLRATARVLCEDTNFKITTNYVANQRDICWAFSREFHNDRNRRATTDLFGRNDLRLRHHRRPNRLRHYRRHDRLRHNRSPHHRRRYYRRLDTAAGGDATTLIIDLDNSLNYVKKVIKKHDNNLQWFRIGISYEVELFGKHISSETEGMKMALLVIQKMAQKAISRRIDDDTFKDMLQEDIPTVESVLKASKSSEESNTTTHSSSSAKSTTQTIVLSFFTNIDPLRLSGCILCFFTIFFTTLIFHLGRKRLRDRRDGSRNLKERSENINTPNTNRFSLSSRSEVSRLFYVKNLVSTRSGVFSDISGSTFSFVPPRKSLGLDFERVAIVGGSKYDYSRRMKLDDENSIL